jgi:F0F1-type ATP synthase membrane subunit b/b'
MAGALDTIVVIVVVGFMLFVMYKALQEPLDKLFATIGRAIENAREKNQGGGNTTRVIRWE